MVETDNKSDDDNNTTFRDLVLRVLLEEHKEATEKVCGPHPWKTEDIGDGNLNYVYRIVGSKGSAVAKLAPPFIKVVPGWKLTADRLIYEQGYLAHAERLAGKASAPSIYATSKKHKFMLMEDAMPCKVFRAYLCKKGEKDQQKDLGKDVGEILARVLFGTSSFALPLAEQIKMELEFRSTPLRGVTEEVIFEEPFRKSDRNGWAKRSPALEEEVRKIQSDPQISEEVFKARQQFRTSCEALLHGDLHTGSVFSGKESGAMVFDAEFVFYGPMCFDTGLFLGNMLLGAYSQRLKEAPEYEKYLLQECENFWMAFRKEFLALWAKQSEEVAPASLLPPKLAANEDHFAKMKEQFMNKLWEDTLRIACIVMIRRIIGLADAPEFRDYDQPTRAKGEKPALVFAAQTLRNLNNGSVASIANVKNLSFAEPVARGGAQGGAQDCAIL